MDRYTAGQDRYAVIAVALNTGVPHLAGVYYGEEGANTAESLRCAWNNKRGWEAIVVGLRDVD